MREFSSDYKYIILKNKDIQEISVCQLNTTRLKVPEGRVYLRREFK